MSKKSTTETGPSAYSKPYISAAANAVQGAYTANQPNLANISSFMQNNMGKVAASTLNNPGLAAASTYNQDVLGGKYLNGNPNLQAVIDNTNSDVSNRVNAAIGTRGGAGGSAQAAIMAREMAKNEAGLRYADYSNERGYQQAAVGNAAQLSGANNSNLTTLLAWLSGQAEIPQSGAQSYAGSIGGLMGPYTSTTQQKSFGQNLMDYLATAAATGAKIAAAG